MGVFFFKFKKGWKKVKLLHICAALIRAEE